MNQVQKLLVKIYRGIGTDRAKRCESLALKSEWTLIQKERLLAPSAYPSATEYFKDAMIVELTRKLLLPGDTASRKAAAVDTFWASEAQCHTTNVRLDRFINHQGPFDLGDEPILQFIAVWRKIVYAFLGKPPDQLSPCYSQGSTLSDQGMLTTIPDKMSSRQTLYTRSAHMVSPHVVGTEFERIGEYRRANRFFTVPKDCDKDRGCCVEASVNIALQLAVGRHLKRRYEKVYGVDLKHSQPLHNDLAQLASITGGQATIDLSNASDTVSRKLVQLILPPDWYTLLNSLRANSTEIDGKTVYLEKFSSMGNGFTFELETIIFRTLCEALGAGRSCMVFGDDIIVNTDSAKAVISALRYFGFTPNEKKTFCEGPFRESCGGDYFNGTPVRAHYLKEIPDEPQKWMALANGLLRADPKLDYLASAWWFCIDQLPTAWRVFGPSYLGDVCLHSYEARPTSKFLRCPQTRKRAPTATLCWPAWVPVTRGFQTDLYWHPHVVLWAALLGSGVTVTPRDSVVGYKKTYIPAYGVDVTQINQRVSIRHLAQKGQATVRDLLV